MPGATPDHRCGAGPPTLLVFTLGAEAEARRHPLLPEGLRDSEVDLRRACLSAVLAAGRAAGCRLELSSPRPLSAPGASWREQHGSTFAERFADALEGALAEAAGPVIAVGTDAPGLGPGHLRTALALLAADENRVVLGPARDGGVYLIAAARPLGSLLHGVTWCGCRTRQSLVRALARARRRVAFLAPLQDLDHPSDLERWIAHPLTGPLLGWARRLGGLLASRRRMARPSRPPFRPLLTAPSPGRAPPALLLPAVS